jgi:hypothetical protein
MASYSQHGEDLVVMKLLPEGGNFIEVGAFDGVTFSNTFALEQNPIRLPLNHVVSCELQWYLRQPQ